MGSKFYQGVRFQCYTQDHLPPHVHAFYAGVEMIFELLPDGTIRIAERKDAVTPVNAPDNTIRRIRRIATRQYAELLTLWETIHGQPF